MPGTVQYLVVYFGIYTQYMSQVLQMQALFAKKVGDGRFRRAEAPDRRIAAGRKRDRKKRRNR
jgi:hypothetical protein